MRIKISQDEIFEIALEEEYTAKDFFILLERMNKIGKMLSINKEEEVIEVVKPKKEKKEKKAKTYYGNIKWKSIFDTDEKLIQAGKEYWIEKSDMKKYSKGRVTRNEVGTQIRKLMRERGILAEQVGLVRLPSKEDGKKGIDKLRLQLQNGEQTQTNS